MLKKLEVLNPLIASPLKGKEIEIATGRLWRLLSLWSSLWNDVRTGARIHKLLLLIKYSALNNL